MQAAPERRLPAAVTVLQPSFIPFAPPAQRLPAEGLKTMSILAWIVLGLIAGFIGSKLVNKSGSGLIMDLVIGVIGAVVGGFLFRQFGHSGVTGLNIYSLMVATLGSVVVLVIYHALSRRRLG